MPVSCGTSHLKHNKILYVLSAAYRREIACKIFQEGCVCLQCLSSGVCCCVLAAEVVSSASEPKANDSTLYVTVCHSSQFGDSG